MFFLQRQMALGAAEFLNLLPRAVAPLSYLIEGSVVSVALGNGQVRITFTQLQPRRIASISLPVLQVEMTASGVEESDLSGFIARFDRSFQRGGG